MFGGALDTDTEEKVRIKRSERETSRLAAARQHDAAGNFRSVCRHSLPLRAEDGSRSGGV